MRSIRTVCVPGATVVSVNGVVPDARPFIVTLAPLGRDSISKLPVAALGEPGALATVVRPAVVTGTSATSMEREGLSAVKVTRRSAET